MEIQVSLISEAKQLGAAYFGIANLAPSCQGAVTPYEAKLITEFPVAVSIGVPLSDAVINSLANQSDRFALQNYRYHAFDMVDPLLNIIILRLSNILMENGFLALSVPPGKTMDTDKHYGLFSHKMAANLAGLGWIGKSCLLITPDRGPRVRWGTILTNAPLATDKPIQEEHCGNCLLCVEGCPAHAFTGQTFKTYEGREVRMDVAKCYHYVQVERMNTIGVNVCGLCVYVCPFGRGTDNTVRIA
ncbi:MAG: epoxyqueuosine reductase [Chloroflexota bacterium]|nr:MAG: epoxyqueuosine reductase [Chloroflexota bacterium]